MAAKSKRNGAPVKKKNQNPQQPLQARVSRVAGIILGLAMLVAGVFKAIDPWTFIGSLPAYGVPEILHYPIVIALPALEIALGVMLIAGWQLRWAGMVSIALIVVFGAAIAYGWGLGDLEECGCFGPFVQRSPGQALLQDFGLLILAILAVATPASSMRPLTRQQLGVLGVVAVVAFSVSAAGMTRDTSTVGSDVTQSAQLIPGEAPAPAPDPTGSMSRPAPSDLAPSELDLENREYLVYMFHPRCPHCNEAGPVIATYANHFSLPSLVGFTFDAVPAEVDEYKAKLAVPFPVYQLPSRAFVQFTGDGAVPQLVYVRKGEIVRVWRGMPPSAEQMRDYIASVAR
jgi:hypothetical protein